MPVSIPKILREVHGYTQEKVAAFIAVSQNTYSRLERAPQKFNAFQVQKLAELYNVSIGAIISTEPPKVIFPNTGSKNVKIERENEIERLKDELAYLRNINQQLISTLSNNNRQAKMVVKKSDKLQ